MQQLTVLSVTFHRCYTGSWLSSNSYVHIPNDTFSSSLISFSANLDYISLILWIVRTAELSGMETKRSWPLLSRWPENMTLSISDELDHERWTYDNEYPRRIMAFRCWIWSIKDDLSTRFGSNLAVKKQESYFVQLVIRCFHIVQEFNMIYWL